MNPYFILFQLCVFILSLVISYLYSSLHSISSNYDYILLFKLSGNVTKVKGLHMGVGLHVNENVTRSHAGVNSSVKWPIKNVCCTKMKCR